MTGAVNPSQEFGFYLEGNGQASEGMKAGCGMVRQVFQKTLSGGCVVTGLEERDWIKGDQLECSFITQMGDHQGLREEMPMGEQTKEQGMDFRDVKDVEAIGSFLNHCICLKMPFGIA